MEVEKAWLVGQEPLELDSIVPHASINLRQAYKEKNQIGWRHFLQGRILLIWAHFINFEIMLNNMEGRKGKFKCKTPESWGTLIFLIQWTHIIKLWDARKNVQARNKE